MRGLANRAEMEEQPLSVPPLRLQATGYASTSSITGRMALGPCEHVDPSLVQLMAQMAQVLYASAGAMRTLPPSGEDESRALRELLTASVAIAATEAETFATLCSLDLCATARIHARSLGDLARRFVLLPNHRDIAKRMYDASNASRRQLYATAPLDNPARLAIEAAFEGDATTMEQLERHAYDADDQSAELFMTAFEARYMSKWNHADIVALAEAGQRLLAAADNVRTTLVVDVGADAMLYRAVMAVLSILFVIRKLYGVEIQDRLDDFTARFNIFKASFDAEADAEHAGAEAIASRRT